MKKVSELTGAELDYWVAKANGAEDAAIEDWGGFHKVCVTAHNAFEKVPFLPSTKWSDGGPIIEREMISCECYLQNPPVWRARDWAYEVYPYDGPTMLVAGLRCFVASKFGDTVDDCQTHNL